MTDFVKNLELLFDRPNEPLVTPKGEDKLLFNLSKELLPKGYEEHDLSLLETRFGESEKIDLVPLAETPMFPLASQLPFDSDFSIFLPKHQQMADEVIDKLLEVPVNRLGQFLSTCVFTRGHINPQLFHYCFSVALLHRHDTKAVKIPNLAESFPSKFVKSTVFAEARQITSVVPEQLSARRPLVTIPRDYTGSSIEPEHRLAYFREDLGINLHHWHWHLVYPFRATHGNRTLVAKDRRGELFFYMHQQIIARYNGERLNNGLARVKKFSEWREPIPEAYFPKLDSLTSQRGYPPRQANMKWQDLNRPVEGINLTISDMERWRRNVEEAIALGHVDMPDGSTQPLDIDMLGNMMESSILSPNPQKYGSLHNNGHSFTAYIHDPNHRYLEDYGVMADEATTMRDPYFYRWHGFIDDLFQRFKQSPHVRPYANSELSNPGVTVTSVSIEPNTPQGSRNQLNTYWMTSDVDLSRGLDFTNRGPVYVRFTHLNHRPFRYVINVNNTGNARRTTVRIFLAPKLDEGNRSWVLSDQRKLFIEMDKFVHELRSGRNVITRQSSDSSVTIPFEQTFRDLSRTGRDPGDPNHLEFNFCGCGWPQHMLVPKGDAAGRQYVLFVMLSNYDLDRVESANVNRELTCKEASSFCGLRDRKYPDRRAMGFPFDRPSSTAATIDDFITPNMAVRDITIRLSEVTENNPRNPTN